MLNLKNIAKMLLVLIIIFIASALSYTVFTEGEKLGMRHISGKEFFFSSLAIFVSLLISFFFYLLSYNLYKDGKSDLPFLILAIIFLVITIAIIIGLSIIYIEAAAVSVCILPTFIIVFLLMKDWIVEIIKSD